MQVKTPNSKIDTTITAEGIEIYLNCTYDNATNKYILSSKQEPSTDDDTKVISINTKTLYAKVPLNNKAIIGNVFNISTKIF